MRDRWEYDYTPRRRKPKIRGRYIVLPLLGLVLILLVTAFASSDDETEDIVVAERNLLEAGDLARITPEVIRANDLTIDWDLQSYIAETVKNHKVYFAAVAVMDAKTGDLLAMYGKGPQEEDSTICLDTYLAASTFKTVTATAALEYSHIKPDSVFEYNGKSTTLYKSQLNAKRNRWTRKVALKDAYARSNNVVFAKIGTNYLGESPLMLQAMRYGFWQPPLREVVSQPSQIFIPRSDYNLAELSSGFNRETKISPVHAAMMASAVVNEGKMACPRISLNTEGVMREAMSAESAEELKSMMRRTIDRGTMSKAFRGYKRDRILRNLEIGAKSGSINGSNPDGRRNWFMGYATDTRTGRSIAVGTLIIREDYFWIEADGLSRKIIRYYFSNPVETLAFNQ